MKHNYTIYPVLITGLLLLFIFSCKKEAPKSAPTITVAAITNITATSATCGGDISNDGGAAITARGVCWSTTDSLPTIASSKTSDGMAVGSFTSTLTGLTMNTKYFVRAYATNSAGTSYGNTISFISKGIPVISTATLSTFTGAQATSGCLITSDGGYTVTAKGICWSTSANPTLSNSYVLSTSTSSVLINLTPATTYHVRAYATNSLGTAYGNDLSFNSGQVLGSNYGGGLVVYNNGSGGGLICANANQSSGAPWGCQGTFITLTNTGVGTGQANTTAIVNNCSTTGTAARICNDLVLNSYSDWYLPSNDEMTLVIAIIHLTQGVIFWSSSETGADGAYSPGKYDGAGIGGGPPADYKSILHLVRAVRTF